MKTVWTSPPSVLQTALSRYKSALPPKPQINDLETFLATLRNEIPTRKPPHITASEYSKLIKWKLMRGKWRPRLQKFADAITDEDMVPSSTSAFAAYSNGDSRAALKYLTELRGCGPASASLVLALVGACFMGDEVLEVALGERKYTEKAFLQLQEATGEKCKLLGGVWNAWDLERAVFAAVKLGMSNGAESPRKEEGARVARVNPERKAGKAGSEKSVKGSTRDKGGKRERDWQRGDDGDARSGVRRSKRIRNKNDG